MSKPIVNKVSAFDALLGTTITMSYVGDSPKWNRVIIYDASTMSKVYDGTHDGYALEHDITAGLLENGKKYAVQCQIYFSKTSYSVLSDKVYFWCLATPLFYFKNINDGAIMNNASFYAELEYEQENGESISEYRFYLYNNVKQLLIESNSLYSSDVLSYSYKGLENGEVYYIRAEGSTVNGFLMDTGFVKVFVSYEQQSDYKYLYAECDRKDGVVTYQTNFTIVNPSDINTQYEYNNGCINLVGKTLVYNENFSANGDLKVVLKGYDLFRTHTLFKCINPKHSFELSSYTYDDDTLRFRLTAGNGLCSYILYSEAMAFSDTDIVTITITRVNNIYQLDCAVTMEGGVFRR
jgi:hypothetical protein